MTNASLNGDQMTGQKLDGTVFKIDEQTSFKGKEAFIGVGMRVPNIGFYHGADSNFVVVHLRNRMVIVPLRCGFQFQSDDFGRRILHFCQYIVLDRLYDNKILRRRK